MGASHSHPILQAKVLHREILRRTTYARDFRLRTLSKEDLRRCSKRLSNEAARNVTTEAYIRRYVAGRDMTENEVGRRFQPRLGEAFHICNDRMQTTRSCRLRADEFGNLQVALDVCGADDDLVFASFWRMPAVIPDHP